MAEQIKPGWKTTEFWLSLAAAIIGLFIASGVLPGTHIAMQIAGVVLVALAKLGYTASRVAVKKAAIGPAPVNGVETKTAAVKIPTVKKAPKK